MAKWIYIYKCALYETPGLYTILKVKLSIKIKPVKLTELLRITFIPITSSSIGTTTLGGFWPTNPII
jgi:hypothetical protein